MLTKKENKPTIPLFVYGSLQTTLRLNYVLRKYDSEFYDIGQTKEKFGLYDLGQFPGIAELPDGEHIRGEVYYIYPECLEVLDKIEGQPEHYTRKKYKIVISDKEMVCFLYEWNNPKEEERLLGYNSWIRFLDDNDL